MECTICGLLVVCSLRLGHLTTPSSCVWKNLHVHFQQSALSLHRKTTSSLTHPAGSSHWSPATALSSLWWWRCVQGTALSCILWTNCIGSVFSFQISILTSRLSVLPADFCPYIVSDVHAPPWSTIDTWSIHEKLTQQKKGSLTQFIAVTRIRHFAKLSSSISK